MKLRGEMNKGMEWRGERERVTKKNWRGRVFTVIRISFGIVIITYISASVQYFYINM